MKVKRQIRVNIIIITLLLTLLGIDAMAKTFRCSYTSPQGEEIEYILRDSFSVANYGKVISVYSKPKGATDSLLLLSLDSLHRSYSLTLNNIPHNQSSIPLITNVCNKPRLLFWVECVKTNITLLHSQLMLLSVDLNGVKQAAISVSGRQVPLAMSLNSTKTEMRYWTANHPINTEGDSCECEYLKLRLLHSQIYTDANTVPTENPLNYAIAWEMANSVTTLSELTQIKFVYYQQPLFPMRPSRIVENSTYKVMAFPFGDVLAYNKAKKQYFAVWASKALPLEDYSASISLDEHHRLRMQGFYDKTVRHIDLESGTLFTEEQGNYIEKE